MRLSVILVVGAVYSLYHFNSRAMVFQSKDTWEVNQPTVALSVFWVLGPPLWFFVEYYAAVSTQAGKGGFVIQGLDPKQVKDFADFSSKIWAAFFVIFGLTLSNTVKVREKEITSNQKKASATRPRNKTEAQNSDEILGHLSSQLDRISTDFEKAKKSLHTLRVPASAITQAPLPKSSPK